MTAPPTQTPAAPATDDRSDRGFFGQPWALANLFGVEMWERFSFYGMQGILVIYLYYSAAEGGLGIDQVTATGIVGAYGGGVYLATILGAWVADRMIGPERTLFAAAVVVMSGHVALALIPGLAGIGVGLSLVALGSGGVKANATSLVGSLYDGQDPRRDAGFSLFYMGINLGAFAGPLLTGLLQKNEGFHYGFGLAAIGMAFGLVQYSIGRRGLPEETREVPNRLESGALTKYAVALAVAAGVVAVLAVTGLRTPATWRTEVRAVVSVAAVAYFVVILTSSELSDTERTAGSPASRCPCCATRCSGRSTSSSSRWSRSSATSGWTATCSAGRCRSPGSTRSTRCSSSCSPARSRPCGPGWASGSRSPRSSSGSARGDGHGVLALFLPRRPVATARCPCCCSPGSCWSSPSASC